MAFSAAPTASRPHRALRRAPSKHCERAVIAGVASAFAAVAVQLLNLGLTPSPTALMSVADPVATSFSRPDIIDRSGRLLATDLEVPSIYADPAIVLDKDELVEQLARFFPDIDRKALRRELSDRSRRFVWIRRGVTPAVAQQIHDLGVPGLGFRSELKRAYPAGSLAAHVLGATNIDNRGVAGVEKFIDDKVGVDAVHAARLSTRAPVRLSIDIGVQHALEDELDTALRRYSAAGAAGLVMDIQTGEVLASASFPRTAPSAVASADPSYADRIFAGSYELGSVFKVLTVAMALDEGLATLDTLLDVRTPLGVDRFTIEDLHPAGRPLTVAEVFTHSSNVGAGMLAQNAGGARMKKFFGKLGLLERMTTEAGPVGAPQLPRRWDGAELVTMSYGHGIAVAPLQFAAAAATVLNGGARIQPTFLRRLDGAEDGTKSVVTANTARRMAELFRLNVNAPDGTGRRAEAPGYRVGGKTGTAERAGTGGYDKSAVLSSFLGAFPMDKPRFLTFVLLFEPKAVAELGNSRTASANAAPVTARLVSRIAPALGVAPQMTSATN